MASRGGGRRGGRGGGRRAVHVEEEHQEEEEHEGHEQNQEQEGQQDDRKELDPSGLWFDDSSVTRVLTAGIHRHFNYPWQNYSQVDPPTKAHWFNMFKSHFRWRPEHETEVRKGFDHKAAKRLKDIHFNVTKQKSGVCPKWMPQPVHEAMMKNAEDGEFKKRSEKAQRNRRGGADPTTVVPPSNCQGSISASERARRLAAKNGGVLPNTVDLYLDTHFKEEPGKGKTKPVSGKAKQVKDSYDKNVAECQQSGIQKDLNQIFFDTVGGRKKGKVHGLGASQDLYYYRSSRRTGTPSTTCTPSIVSQLSQRMEEADRARSEADRAREESDRARAEYERERLEMERQRLQMETERMEWIRAREEERRREKEYLEEMKRTVESYGQIVSQCSGSFLFPLPRDPRDPSGGSGSTGACAT